MIQFNDAWLSESVKESSYATRTRATEALLEVQKGICQGSDYIGWFNYPKKSGFSELNIVSNAIGNLEVDYDTIVVIGIGGSYLGTRAVSEALGHRYIDHVKTSNKPIIYCGHHLSESELLETLDLLETRLPLVTVISKSGTTTEPGIAFRIIRKFMEDKFGLDEARRRIVAITDPEKGALREVANREGYLSFDIPPDVGGRYSVLSPVGIVPLLLAGYDVSAMMEGAHLLFSSIEESSEQELAGHPVVTYAAARFAAYQQGHSIELLAYAEPKLGMLVEWWKQLFGESEGKEGKGIFPAGLAYTTDLHSLGQLAQEGERNLFETFLIFEQYTSADAKGLERRLKVPQMSDNQDMLGYLETRYVEDVNAAAVRGTKVAHHDGGVPCMELRLKKLDAFNLGVLIAFFEAACAVGGGLLGVNAFDQPGVEEYKRNLFGLLGKPGFEEVGRKIRERFID